LTQEAGAACAERGANGEFTRAGGGAGEQQARNIGADDQEQQAEGAGEQQERRAYVGDDGLLERADARVAGEQLGFGIEHGGVRSGVLAIEDGELFAGLIDGDVRL
jgi:hypothetical protein